MQLVKIKAKMNFEKSIVIW